MKRVVKTASMMLAALGILVSTSGCGKKDNNNNGGGGPGVTNTVVQTIPGGAATVYFTGSNIYVSSVLVSAGQLLTQNNYFVDPGYGAWMFLNNQRSGGPGTISMSGGVPGNGQPGVATLYGVSGLDGGNQLSMTVQQGSDYFHYNVLSGQLNLSAQWVQRIFGGSMPSVIGLTIDVGLNGTTLGAGGVLIYTSVDQAGYHGAFLAF